MERVKKILKSDKGITWLFYGDSITQGVKHCGGSKNYCEIFSERVRYELCRKKDIVINSGISSNTTRDLVACFKERCERFKPEVVFIMIGMNDFNKEKVSPEDFEQNLCDISTKILSWKGIVVFQTTCPVLCPDNTEMSETFELYMNIIKKLAVRLDMPLIDHYSEWKQDRQSHFFRMNNNGHPNAQGHIVFAHYIFKELGIFDPNSNMCRLFTIS